MCIGALSTVFPNAAYAESEVILNVDLSECSAGDYVPGSVGLGSGNTKKFKVIDVDDTVSRTGKAVEYSSSSTDLNNNSELYFSIPEINTTNIDEVTDYYIGIKLMHYPVGSSVDTGMQLKLVGYNSEKTSTSNRLFNMGLGSTSIGIRAAAGKNGGYADGVLLKNEWYSLVYNIHLEPDSSKNCVNLKMYKVGDPEPEGWQTTLSSGDFGSESFSNSANINLFGIKAYRTLTKFTDFNISKYNEDDFVKYEEVKNDINDAAEKIDTGSMTYDESIKLSSEIEGKIDTLDGVLKNLAWDAWDIVNKDMSLSIESVEIAEGIIAELKDTEISDENYEYLYGRINEARKTTDNISFSDKYELYTNAVDEQEKKLLDYAKKFAASEYFDYDDGMNIANSEADSDNGWADGWQISSGSAVVSDGILNTDENFSAYRTLLSPVTYNSGRIYYISWRMNAGSDAGIDIDGIKGGVSERDGKLYAVLDETVSDTELEKGKEYGFIIAADMSNNKYGLWVYENGTEPKLSYHAVSSLDSSLNIEKIGLYSNGGTAEFDEVTVRMTNYLYGQKISEKVFAAYNAPYGTDEESEEKENLLREANADVSKLEDGGLKDYLVYVCGVAEKNIVDAKVTSLFDLLDSKLNLEDIDAAQEVIDSILNDEVRKSYQEKLDVYREKIKNTTPVVESVGISGTVKAGSSVSAVIKIIDEVGNGADPIIEWYAGGKKVAENVKSVKILSSWASANFYCMVTPVNTDGIKGTPVKSTGIKIPAVSSSGGGSGGSSGGGGTVKVVPADISFDNEDNNTVLSEDTQIDKKFADIENHWASSQIYRAFEKGIVSGVSETAFEPERAVTRAEFVKMLCEGIGLDISVNGDTGYDDVASDAWYAPYIKAASDADIVSGSEGMFRPDDSINREEAAKIIVLAYRLKNNADINADEVEYADKNKISSWAQTYVNECTELGIMNGLGDNNFSPKSGTTRAQAVVIIMRLIDLL